MTKNKSKRYPVVLDDLLTEFDEADYVPMNFCEDPVKEAIAWKDNLRYELDLLLGEKSAIERRAVEEFAQKIKGKMHDLDEGEAGAYFLESDIDKLLKEYENE